MSSEATLRPASGPSILSSPVKWWRRLLLKSEPLRGYTLMSPTVLLMLLSLGAPALFLLVVSFWSQHLLDITPGFSFDNYLAFLEKDNYQALLWRSIKISGFVTILTVLLAYPMAYFIAFRVKGNKFAWLILITVPFWTSYLLRVFAWKIILGYNGVINSGLTELGLIEAPLKFLLYNPFAVVVTLAHAWAAFAILPIYVALEKIDKSVLEAAMDLGDSPARRFFRVTLPLSMAGVVAAALLVFIPTVGDFVTPAVVGGPKGLMIGNLIQLQFAKANNWPLGAALSVISLMSITLIVCAFLWFTKRVRTQNL